MFQELNIVISEQEIKKACK